MRRARTASAVLFFLWLAAPLAALTSPLPDWLQRINIGGSAAVRAMDGRSRSQLERNSGAMVYQAGLVLDADVAPDVSFWYDFSLIREGVSRANSPIPLEQVYVRWDHLFDQPWLNAKMGRTFTPFGEEYLRWNAIDNPLASWSVSFPWALDEGIVFFGDALPEGKLSYAAAVQNGNATFNFDDNARKAVSARLTARPTKPLSLSASVLSLGGHGNYSGNGAPEWWLSGFRVAPVGQTSAAGWTSTGTLVDALAAEVDATLQGRTGRVWANAGMVKVKDDGAPEEHHRLIRYFTVEGLGNLPGGKAYVIARYSAIGTFDPARGYHFAGTEAAVMPDNNSSPYAAYNFDQESLSRLSVGGGWRFSDRHVLKAEYSFENTRLIGAGRAGNPSPGKKRNFAVLELAVRF